MGITHSKTRSNPENNVALMTLSDLAVLVTLTTDTGKILAKLHQVNHANEMKFISGIKIAHLCLKHRQGKNHKTRIIAFVGSPIEADEKEVVKLDKKLKKEKVNIDIVSFGEDEDNTDILNKFITTINGKEGTGSHLVTIPPGPHLSDALVSSPIVQGEDGMGALLALAGAADPAPASAVSMLIANALCNIASSLLSSSPPVTTGAPPVSCPPAPACRLALCSSIETRSARASSGSSSGLTPNSKPLDGAAPMPSSPWTIGLETRASLR